MLILNEEAVFIALLFSFIGIMEYLSYSQIKDIRGDIKLIYFRIKQLERK